MRDTRQLEFPYGSLAFVNRTTLRPQEVAEKFGCSKRHIENLIEEGKMGDINISAVDWRRWSVIPIEEYANFVLKNMSGDARLEFLRHLPNETLDDYINALCAEKRRRQIAERQQSKFKL